MGNEGLVAIVILNFNRANDTIECIKTIVDSNYKNYRILLLDNCSTDDSMSVFEKALPNVELVRTKTNLGYTAGINAGIRHVQKYSPEYILLLNNDTICTVDYLKTLVNALEQAPMAAAACGTILCEHDREQIWYAGGNIIPWRGLAVHSNKGKRFDKEKYQEVQEVSFITGCMILLKANILTTIGYEDERFFMYLDDIELSARIQKKGFKLLYAPKSIIYHKVLNETESPFKLYYSVRNRMVLIPLISRGFTKYFATGYFFSVISVKLIIWRLFNRKFYRAAKAGLEDYFSGTLSIGRGFEFL